MISHNFDQRCQHTTGGLAQAGVYRRGKCSGKLNVCVPRELYRTPRLRQAARTLSASGGDSAADNETEKLTLNKNINRPKRA